MGQQVSNGGASGPGRLVELDDLVVDGGQDRQRGGELGHRRPAVGSIEIAVARGDAVGADERRRGMVRTSRVDGRQGGRKGGGHVAPMLGADATVRHGTDAKQF